MGMGVIYPHSIDTDWGHGAKCYAFYKVDIHDSVGACCKEKGEAGEEKCKCRMVKVLFEKVVEVHCKAYKKSYDAEEQDMTDQHHTEIVSGEDNDEEQQDTSYKDIKPETEESFDKIPFTGFAPCVGVEEAHDADAEGEG